MRNLTKRDRRLQSRTRLMMTVQNKILKTNLNLRIFKLIPKRNSELSRILNLFPKNGKIGRES